MTIASLPASVSTRNRPLVRLSRRVTHNGPDSFTWGWWQTPLVPVIPCLSIYVNIHLMTLINFQTWIRVLIWLLIGIPVYIICLCCYKQAKPNKLEENIKAFADINGKIPVQIIVESPTPPDTMNKRFSNIGGYFNEIAPAELEDIQEVQEMPAKDELIVQHSPLESDEKEAKIIGLLDQVLQAEEDRYEEIIHLKDDDSAPTEVEAVVHRKSLSELSDAGSDASLGNQGLSKYDVIAQVHREDLPIVDEEEEKSHKGDPDEENMGMEEHEEVTAFNESDSNSRTDESGYSDTIMDRTILHDSVEDVKEDAPYIPPPPPLDENYFAQPYFNKFYSIPKSNNRPVSEEDIQGDAPYIPPPPPLDESYFAEPYFKKSHSMPKPKNRPVSEEEIQEDAPYIPPPPPLDENYFAQPYFKKSYSMPKPKYRPVSEEEKQTPRESIQSNSSQGDGNIVFGSDRQINFMSKLNNALQVKLTTSNDDDLEQRKRSHSTGNVVDDLELSVASRPLIFEDLKKELLLGKNLRQVNVDEPSVNKEEEAEESKIDNEETADSSMSRQDLKTKLESIFASGGPKLMKPRLMKSNPPTPEEAYQTESSSTESIPKITKGNKNDTLSRQKAKFGEVLNSFRLSFNAEDKV